MRKDYTSNALDAWMLVQFIIESTVTRIKKTGYSEQIMNRAHVDDAEIRPIYNEEPMAEIQKRGATNGRILKTVCLRWVPTGKTFASSTTKVESEPPNGSNADIPNQCESEQALNVSAGPVPHDKMMSDHNSSDLALQRQEMSVENVSSGLVPQRQKASDYDNSDPVPPRQNVVPSAEKTDSSQQGLEFLFSPLLEEYYNPTHSQAEENNKIQAPNASIQEANLSILLYTVMITDGTENHPLEQVSIRGNPTSQFKQDYSDELHSSTDKKSGNSSTKPFGKMIIAAKKVRKEQEGMKDQTVKLNKADLKLKLFQADQAGCLDTGKSTSGGEQFPWINFCNWMTKKQNSTANVLQQSPISGVICKLSQ
ncbi:hypothetical protein Tco_0477656 [Tanacetum coccineum]